MRGSFLHTKGAKKKLSAEYAVTPRMLSDLKAGDHAAYESVYLHYVTPVRNFLQVLTRSEDVAKELAQSVFITLWEKREGIDPDRNISGYIYKIARNAALKYFNHLKVVEKYAFAYEDWAGESPMSDEIIFTREKELLIEIVLNRMPPRRREIFNMSRREMMSNEEIAQRLQISKNTVENHITSALKDLREALAVMVMLFMMH